MFLRKKRNSRIWKHESGYAMVLAMVVVLLIALASLSLFTASMTGIKNAAKTKDREQARILASSFSDVIADELDAVKVEGGYEQDDSSVYDGNYSCSENSIAAYIYNNLGNGWTWCNEDDPSYVKQESAREIELSGKQLDEIHASLKLVMYWTSDRDAELAGEYSGRSLYIEVHTSWKGRSGTENAVVTTRYEYVKQSPVPGDESKDYYLWKKADENYV